MVAGDPVEQLHSAPLHAEHADRVTDLRPLGIEVAVDERITEVPDVRFGGRDMAPIDAAIPRQRHAARQLHGLARKEAEMLGGFLPAGGLVEEPAARRDYGIAADGPGVRS